MGSALAPFLANKTGVAGIISDGTFVKTWFEHMLEIERRILTFQGNSPAQVMDKINKGYIPLYYGMLIEKKTYGQLVTENPLLAQYNYHAPAHMYGRPMAYYHQLQEFDVAGQWQQVKVPVRIRWGTNDWIMSEQDNDLIIRILEQNGHEDHQLYKYPGMDHWETIHPDYASSFNGKPGIWEDNISGMIVDWAKELVK